MSDYIDKVDIEGTQYDIQDTATKEQTEENTQEIQNIEPVDAVQSGNLNPPTSNAVALALQSISGIKQIRIRQVNAPVSAQNVQNLTAFGVNVTVPTITSGWTKLFLVPMYFNATNAACLSITIRQDLVPGQNTVIYGVAVGGTTTITGISFMIVEYQ